MNLFFYFLWHFSMKPTSGKMTHRLTHTSQPALIHTLKHVRRYVWVCFESTTFEKREIAIITAMCFFNPTSLRTSPQMAWKRYCTCISLLFLSAKLSVHLWRQTCKYAHACKYLSEARCIKKKTLFRISESSSFNNIYHIWHWAERVNRCLALTLLTAALSLTMCL